MFLTTRRVASAACVAILAACGQSSPSAGTPPSPVAPAQRLAAGTDQYFTRGDVRLRYRDVGVRGGEPVVLLHGYTQRIEAMQDLADSLTGSYRVIVLDERGFGESSKFAEPGRYGQAMVDDVIGLLDQLGLRRAHLIGHSMGASVAAQAALRFPARVASATLLAGPFFTDSVAYAAVVTPYVSDLREGKGLTRFVVWIAPGTPDSVASGFSTQLLAQNDLGVLIASLPAIGGLMVSPSQQRPGSVPVLIAVGARDPLLPQSRALAKQWSSARYVEIQTADHFNILVQGPVIAAIRELVPARRP